MALKKKHSVDVHAVKAALRQGRCATAIEELVDATFQADRDDEEDTRLIGWATRQVAARCSAATAPALSGARRKRR